MRNSFSDLIHRGGIYWVSKNPNKPTIGNMERQGRPAVVVSSDACNKTLGTVMVVYLTSQPREEHEAHCTITTAYKPSTVLCEQITTVDKSQIGNYIGTVTDAEMDNIELCMSTSLGCTYEEGYAESEDLEAMEHAYQNLQDKYEKVKSFCMDLLRNS